MIILLVSGLVALLLMYVLSDTFKVTRAVKVDFVGPGLGVATKVNSYLNWSTVKVTFSTTKPSGMLYLNYGPILKGVGPGGGDIDPYVVIYLKEGYLYTYINSDTFVDERLSKQPMSDGEKHTVTLGIDSTNSRVVSTVDKEQPLSHLFRSGDERLGTEVLIGFINTKVRPLYGSRKDMFLPFTGCMYLFELYHQDNLLLTLDTMIYGGKVKKIYYNL